MSWLGNNNTDDGSGLTIDPGPVDVIDYMQRQAPPDYMQPVNAPGDDSQSNSAPPGYDPRWQTPDLQNPPQRIKGEDLTLLPGAPAAGATPAKPPSVPRPVSNTPASGAGTALQSSTGDAPLPSGTGVTGGEATTAPAGNPGTPSLNFFTTASPSQANGSQAASGRNTGNGQPTLEEAEPDFANRPYDALQDAKGKGLLPKNVSDKDLDTVMKMAWSLQQRKMAAEGSKPYLVMGDGTFLPTGDDPVASVDSAMRDGVLDAKPGMELRDRLTRGLPVDYSQYRAISGEVAVHGNDFGILTSTQGAGMPQGAGSVQPVPKIPIVEKPGGPELQGPGSMPARDGAIIRMADGSYGRVVQGWRDGYYVGYIAPIDTPHAQGNGNPLDYMVKQPASAPSQPANPPAAQAQTEAGMIRGKYQRGEIDKATALRLLATAGRTPPQTWKDEAGKIAYETAKGGTVMLGGMAAAAPFAYTGPLAPVLGGAAFMGGSELTQRGIEALENYLAGKSDTFASGLAEQQDAPYAQAIGQTLPLVAMAGGSLKGYLGLAGKGLAPLATKALGSMTGAVGSSALYTGLRQGRLLTGRELRDAMAGGLLAGGTGPGGQEEEGGAGKNPVPSGEETAQQPLLRPQEEPQVQQTAAPAMEKPNPLPVRSSGVPADPMAVPSGPRSENTGTSGGGSDDIPPVSQGDGSLPKKPSITPPDFIKSRPRSNRGGGIGGSAKSGGGPSKGGEQEPTTPDFTKRAESPEQAVARQKFAQAMNSPGTISSEEMARLVTADPNSPACKAIETWLSDWEKINKNPDSPQVQLLQQLMQKVQPHRNETLHRGMYFKNEAEMVQFLRKVANDEGLVNEKPFMSASKEVSTANNFANKGVYGIIVDIRRSYSGRDLQPFANKLKLYEHQREVLFSKGANFRLVRVAARDPYYGKHYYMILEEEP